MITVTENKNGNEIYYVAVTKSDNVTVDMNIFFKTAVCKKNGFMYLILYDEKMNPISSVFDFLNYGMSNKAEHSRLKSLQALKLLFSFSEIIHKKVEDYKLDDINQLKNFIRGYAPKGNAFTFKNLTARNSSTVNGYLSVYRQYVSYMEIKDSLFMKIKNGGSRITLPDYEIEAVGNSYSINERIPHKAIEVPAYISIEDFRNVIEVIREKYTLREEIIVRLMYQCGLRIGEVLGLTNDDLVEEVLSDGSIGFTAYLRNRVSDNSSQNAKTCMNVIDRKQYKLKDYQTAGWGYQSVPVPDDLYDLIGTYIAEAHTKARQNKEKNYYAYTVADRIRKPEPYEEDNFYIFINEQGRPLSQTLWNKTLRKIFIDCGLMVDDITRTNNLNHRFRHGFAMYNVQHMNVNELQLKSLLRHRSIQSVSCYFKPTVGDQVELKTAFTEGLYELIPELKESTKRED